MDLLKVQKCRGLLLSLSFEKSGKNTNIPTQSWKESLTAVGKVEPLTTVRIFFLMASTSEVDKEVNPREREMMLVNRMRERMLFL